MADDLVITPDDETAIREQIDKDALLVDPDRNTKLTIQQNMDRFSRMRAQTFVDKDELVRSKMDWERSKYFKVLEIYCYEVHAARVAAEGKGPGSILKNEMETFEMYHTILNLQMKFVGKRTSGDNLKRVFKKVKKGSGNLDTLHDILAMCVILKEYTDITAQFTPRGVNVNEGYIEMVTADTEALLQLHGIKTNEGTDRSKLVDKQNRLLSLSYNCMLEIREYAEGSFFMDMNYFKKHYTIHDFHKKKTKSPNEEEETTTDTTDPTNTATPPEPEQE